MLWKDKPLYIIFFSVHWKHLGIQYQVPKAVAGIGDGVDLGCSTVPSLLSGSYCLPLNTLSFCKRINQPLKILPVGKGNARFQTGWCCIHWGSQSVNNQNCRILIITSCVCRSAAAFLPPHECWWFVWKFACWVGEWLMKKPFCCLSLLCWKPFSASSAHQLQPSSCSPCVCVCSSRTFPPLGGTRPCPVSAVQPSPLPPPARLWWIPGAIQLIRSKCHLLKGKHHFSLLHRFLCCFLIFFFLFWIFFSSFGYFSPPLLYFSSHSAQFFFPILFFWGIYFSPLCWRNSEMLVIPVTSVSTVCRVHKFFQRSVEKVY